MKLRSTVAGYGSFCRKYEPAVVFVALQIFSVHSHTTGICLRGSRSHRYRMLVDAAGTTQRRERRPAFAT